MRQAADRRRQRELVPRGLFVVALAATLASRPALSLDPHKAITQYVHEAWTTEQGLPHKVVSAITQTRDGYLWIGTTSGEIARFDGVRFKVFDDRSTGGVSLDSVRVLLEDREGNLWIATDGHGLVRTRDGVFTSVPLPHVASSFGSAWGFSSDWVRALHEDREGALWVGTWGGGVVRLRNGESTVFSEAQGLKMAVAALCGDRDGAVWIGTGGRGLYRFQGGSLKSFTIPSDREGGFGVWAVRTDRAGALWFGTNGRGLYRLKDGSFTTLTTKDGLSDDNVHSILEDRQGSLWLGTNNGLTRISEGRASMFQKKDGLVGEYIAAVYEDREGSLWVGTDEGLERFREPKVTPVGLREGLTDEAGPMIEDGQKNLWFGAEHGLKRFRDGTSTDFTTRDGFPKSAVSSLLEDREGNLWFGADGLFRQRDGKLTVLPRSESLAAAIPRAIEVDREGGVWVGTWTGGLFRLKDGVFTTFTRKDGLSNDSVSALLEDREGTLWIGNGSYDYRQGGLNSFKNGEFKSYSTKDGLSSNQIATLHEDAEGVLWIGTLSGLNRRKDGRFTAITTKHGLAADDIDAILEDGDGNFWIGSSTGILRVRKADLNAFADGRMPRVTCVSLGMADGMRTPEGASGYQMQPAAFRARDGRLWFSTSKGPVVVDPAHLPRNELPPPVLVEEVLADEKSLPTSARSRVELRAGTEKIDIRYTALSFVVPKRVRFQYLLEGYDRGWVDAGAERAAHYTHLPPRSYTFRVKAANDDGVWNEKGASFSFTLLPRFYQTWWFFGLEGLTGLGLLAGALVLQRRRLETRRIRELRDAELSRKTEELENARRVQIALLPKEPLTVGAWTVAGSMKTATEVGGDYYGYLEAGGRLCIVIGDATGHGMASGLVAGMLKSALATLKQTTVGSEGPAMWLAHLNTALRDSIAQRGLGVCVGIGLVDVTTGEVELGMAGIPHPFHVSASGAATRLPMSGTPLGYLKRIVTATATRMLAPGDRLVLITDGLIEQVSAAGEEWGYAGVEGALAAACANGAAPETVAAHLLAACEAHGAGRPCPDDRTVVVLARSAR